MERADTRVGPDSFRLEAGATSAGAFCAISLHSTSAFFLPTFYFHLNPLHNELKNHRNWLN
jgi:hypothetical protein